MNVIPMITIKSNFLIAVLSYTGIHTDNSVITFPLMANTNIMTGYTYIAS